MLKIVLAVCFLFTMTKAGYLGAPLAYHAPIVAAPLVVKAHIPVATSYQNTLKISAAPVPILVKASPIVAAPLIKAAPLFAAPALHYAPAPSFIKSPLFATYGYH